MKRWIPMLIAAVWTMACSSSADVDSDVSRPDASSSDVSTVDAGAPDAAADVGTVEPYRECAPYSVAGPHPVGVRTVELGGATVELLYPVVDVPDDAAFATYDLRDWMPAEDASKISDAIAPLMEYPAYRDLPLPTERFPVVLFSHGFGGYRLQSSVLVATIASWGYVVVAPEHPERNVTEVLTSAEIPTEDNSAQTLRAVMSALKAEADGASELGAIVDLENVAVTGHSAGGFAALTVGGDADFDLVVTWASREFSELVPFDTPSVVVGGGQDRVVAPGGVHSLYEKLNPPKQELIVTRLGHLGFADLCLIGRDEGGVLKIAEDAGVQVPAILKLLAKDGCLPQDLPPEEGWPLVLQATLSNLEHRLRGAAAPDTEQLGSCFGDLVQRTEVER